MRRSLYPVVWKELRDMARDIKTLVAISLLPLLMMPLMGITSIYVQTLQQGVAVVINEDPGTLTIGNATFSTNDLANSIVAALKSKGFRVLNHSVKSYDIMIIIPKGFRANLSSLTRVALIRIVKSVGSAKSNEGENTVQSVLGSFARKVAEAKVKYLGTLAKKPVTPDSVLNPIVYTTVLVGPSGTTVSVEESFRVMLGRILAFSLVFVTTPSIAYITDSVVGEKERKTFEALLATPVPRWSLVIGKTLSASVIGLITGLADAVGLLLFFALPSMTYGVNLFSLLTPGLMIAHVSAVYLSVLASLALILPIVIRSGSYRVAQAFSLAIISVASVVFFISLYADINALTAPLRYTLYVIPYSHAVGMIKRSVLGEVNQAAIHALVIIAEIGVLLALAVKLFSEEKIIYSKT